MSLSHAFAQLSSAGCHGASFGQSGITLPQVTPAQERALLGFSAAAFLLASACVAVHALSLVTAFS